LIPAPILLGLIFVATFAFVISGLYFAAGWLKTAGSETDGGLLLDGLEGEQNPILLRADTVSSISILAQLLEKFQLVPKLRKLIGEAGLNWSVGRFVALMLLASSSTAVVLSRIAWLPSAGVLVGGVMAMAMPFFYLRHKRQRRYAAFEENFPDVLDSLGRAMRAGHALAAGMEIVAYEAPQPISGEFRKVLEEWRLGRNWDQALGHLRERLPLVSVSLFVAAVRMQNRTGGKLHEVLGRISASVREAAALDGEIRAISAHGKMTGAILSALPIGIALMLNWTSPGYLDILVDHPIGKYLIIAAVFFLIAAHFVMRRILDIRI
jgi:tight adherence protein B